MTEQKSYWGENGKYQLESEFIAKKVPNEGESFDTRIELYRVAQNVYYDIFNNGGCNLMRDCSRNDELEILQSKVDTKKLDEYVEIYQNEQDNFDELGTSESDGLFDSVCDSMDLIMDSVIEKIAETGYFDKLADSEFEVIEN